jgi:ketosteroid isomerase-like protein
VSDDKSVEARNKQIVQTGFDKWKAGRGGVFDLLAPDAKWTITGNSPVSKTYQSKQEFIDEVINPFNARMSKRFAPTTIRGIYADGDMVIAFFDGAGTALDGKPYENTYTWYLRMKDGKIVDVVAFFDTIEFTDFWTRITPVGSKQQAAGGS